MFFKHLTFSPRSTALENVMLPLVYAGISKEEREERGLTALNKVGLADRSNHSPTNFLVDKDKELLLQF